MTFHVGQRVVCIEDKTTDGGRWYGDSPTKGAIYTVRRVYLNRFSLQLWLDEIDRCVWARIALGPSVGYGAWRFRPLIDISDLESIVAEVRRGSPRSIPADKFDRAKVPAGVAPNHSDASSPAGHSHGLPAAPSSDRSPHTPDI